MEQVSCVSRSSRSPPCWPAVRPRPSPFPRRRPPATAGVRRRPPPRRAIAPMPLSRLRKRNPPHTSSSRSAAATRSRLPPRHSSIRARPRSARWAPTATVARRSIARRRPWILRATDLPGPRPERRMQLRSLQTRLTGLSMLASLSGALVYAGLTQGPVPQVLAWLRHDPRFGLHLPTWPGISGSLLAAMLVLLPLAFWLGGLVMSPIRRLLRALEGAVASFRDGDFSFSISADRRDELGALIRMHNTLGQTLREQRQHLVQRELLLDSVVQHTPVSLVLANAQGRIAYANIAARHLFNEGRSLNGLDFGELLLNVPEALRRAEDC